MYVDEMKHFLDCLARQSAYGVPIPDAAALMRIVFAAKASAEQGKMLAVGEVRGVISCLIQARMGSSRFPGKVLQDLSGRPMLWHVVNRVRRAQRRGQGCGGDHGPASGRRDCAFLPAGRNWYVIAAAKRMCWTAFIRRPRQMAPTLWCESRLIVR